MYSFDLFYKTIPASLTEEFPYNLSLSVVKIYSDISLSNPIGTLSFKSEIASLSSESNSNTLYSNIATISLDNGNIIIYSYLRNGTKTISPNIIYSTETFSNVKKLTREYLTDELKKITFFY